MKRTRVATTATMAVIVCLGGAPSAHAAAPDFANYTYTGVCSNDATKKTTLHAGSSPSRPEKGIFPVTLLEGRGMPFAGDLNGDPYLDYAVVLRCNLPAATSDVLVPFVGTANGLQQLTPIMPRVERITSIQSDGRGAALVKTRVYRAGESGCCATGRRTFLLTISAGRATLD